MGLGIDGFGDGDSLLIDIGFHRTGHIGYLDGSRFRRFLNLYNGHVRHLWNGSKCFLHGVLWSAHLEVDLKAVG
ncbi:hypothetical protein D3C73_1408600 [compost metagenome]